MNKKNAIILTIMILFLGLLISGGTYAYWSWTNSSHKNIVFNTAKELQEYIVYDEGNSSFTGSLEVGNSFNQGIHSTISIKKTAEAANVDLVASIMMDINSIGTNMKQSSALKWVVTSGDSTNVGNVLAQGNFIGTNSGDTLTLYPSIEVTTTEKKFTIWIWLDASENPSELLSGETLDTVVWTQIDQLEGVHDTFEITRISANYQNISATVVNNKYLITDYAVTNSNTTPSNWTTITSADQSHVYTLNYTALSTGTYYVWFKDSNGAIVSDHVEVTIVDTTGPNCTFGSFSKSAVNNGGKATINLDCVDNESNISTNNLKNSDLVLSENNAEITNINKTSITNGYRYTITLTGTSTDGLVTLTLPQNKIRNAANYGNSEAISGNLMIDNVKPVCTLSTPATVAFGNTTTAILTCTDNYLINSQTLANSNFTTSDTSVATINSISEPTTVSGGFQYTLTLNALKSGTYSLKLNANSVSDAAGNKNELTSSANATVSKVNCPAPTNIQIASNGDITFTAPTVSAGTISYQISTNSSSGFTTITNGGNYLSQITSQAGSRTVYVRSVCDSTYYNTPSTSATATTTVYSVTLYESTGGKTFINNVSGSVGTYTYDEKSINVITGGTAYLYAQPDTNYMLLVWNRDIVYGTITNDTSYNTTVTNVTDNSYIEPQFAYKNYINTTTNTYYSSLGMAFSAVQNNQTIKALVDVTDSDATLSTEKTGIKLDLNGHTISLGQHSIFNYGTLDIYSSSAGGMVQGNNTGSNGVINNSGTLTTNGTSSVNSITIRNTSNSDVAKVIHNNTGNSITLNTNTIITNASNSSASGYLIRTSGTLNIYGASLSSEISNGISISGANGRLVMTSGSIDVAGSAISNNGTMTENPAVDISGGTIQTTGSYAISASGSGTINISGGNISGKYGIFANNSGIINIDGSTTQISGTSNYGISCSGKTINISGGNISSNNSGLYINTGVVTMTGGTITGNQHGVNISGAGTFTMGENGGTPSTTSPLVRSTSSSGSTNYYGVKIGSSGTFNFYDGKIISTRASGFAINGEIDNIPSGYVVHWFYADNQDTVVLGLSGTLSYLNAEKNIEYDSLSTAFTNVANNQTIQVLDDTDESTNTAPSLGATKTGIKLDLNGHTISLGNNKYITNNGGLDIYSSASGGRIESSYASSSFGVIHNYGTLTTNATDSTNTITISNTSNGSNATTISNGSGKTLTLNTNTIITNASNSSASGYLIRTSGTLNIYGASLSSEISNGISISSANGRLVMTSGSIDVAGSAINNTGTMTENPAVDISGGTIQTTGSFAISASGSGTVNISGGNISGKYGIFANNSGIINIDGSTTQISGTSNYGISCSGKTINISGGNISSNISGLYINTGVVTMTGGTITGNQHGVNISGAGTFTMGENGGTPSTTSPLVRSTSSSGSTNYYGVKIGSSGTLNFYDGKITSTSGINHVISNDPNNIATGYNVYKYLDDGVGTAILSLPYTINYALNGGTAAANTPSTGYIGANIEIPNPTKANYSFVGWTSSSADGLSANALSGTSSSSLTPWNGQRTLDTHFNNLTSESGTVTLTANWGINYLNVDTNQDYLTLDAAFDDVQNNQTIRVLNSVDESSNTAPELTTGKIGIKLDLNGNTISLGGNTLVNNGELDIYNSSSTDGILQGSASGLFTGVVTNYGTLTVNKTFDDYNVKIQNSSNVASSVVMYLASGGNTTLYENCTVSFTNSISSSRQVIRNGGIVTINGATIINISSGFAISFTGDVPARIIINSGYIEAAGVAIGYILSDVINNNLPSIEINGGTINAGTSAIVSYSETDGKIKITDGILNSDTGNAIRCVISSNVEYIVEGGSIESNNGYGIEAGDCNFNITGGTVIGGTSGIYHVGTGIVNVGDIDLIPTDTSPVISSTASSGTHYGVENDGIFNFYGGKVTAKLGAGSSIKNTPTNVYPNYSISKAVASGIETAKLVSSVSTIMPATEIINGTDDGASTGYFLNTNIPRNTITTIQFSNQLNSCTVNNSTCYDISSTQDGSVKMYGSNGNYTISQSGGVVFPYNSSSLFYNLVNLTSIDMSQYINLNNVNNMSYMFYGDSSLSQVYFPTSNLVTTNIEGIFNGCTSLTTINKISYLGTNLTNINNAFLNTSLLNNSTLNTILGFCSNSSNIDSSKRNATYIGMLQSYYDGKFNNSSLSNYNAYVDAGWTFWD